MAPKSTDTEHSLSSRTLITLFVFALALRLSYLAMVWTGPLGNADSAAYKALAITLANGQPYQAGEGAGPGGFPTDLQRPPGYPAFLALVNSSEAISHYRTAVVQCLLGAFFAVLLGHWFGAVTTPTGGFFAGLFYATDWITIIHTPMVIPETVYSIMLGLAILVYGLVLKKASAPLSCLAGLLLGVAALVKPAAQLVVPAFLAGWVFQKPRNKAALLFLVEMGDPPALPGWQ